MRANDSSVFCAVSKQLIYLSLSLVCLGAFASASVQAADIRVLAAGGDLLGNQASNEIFTNGDLTGSIARPPWSEYRLLTTADIINNYDVLVIPHNTADWQYDIDWHTRIIPFLASGGGVVYEAYITTTSDNTGLIASQLGTRYVCADGTICWIPNSGLGLEPVAPVNVLPVAGLADGIGADFTHTDGYFTGWDASLSPVLDINAIDLGTLVYGLQGQYDAGRIVVTQSSADTAGLSTGTAQQANSYNWLVNKIRWTSASTAQPNPDLRVVPNLTSYTEADMLTALANAGIVANIFYTTTTLEAWGNNVGSDPNPGSGIFAGDTLNVFVVDRPAGVPVTTPDVRDLPTADAETALLAVGLERGSTTFGSHPTIVAGNIIAQNFVPGTDNITTNSVSLVESTGPDATNAPYVRYLTQAQAQTAITASGFVVGTVTSQGDNVVPSGYVIGQTTGALAAGDSVALVVSSGSFITALISTPATVGLSLTAARNAVANAGLIPLIVITQISATVPAGNVISQNPAAGAMLANEGTVNFVISSGTTGDSLVKSPVLENLGQTAAESAITGHGLVTGSITFAASSTVADGDVISSNPAAGILIALGSAVDLVIAGTATGVTVPDILGLAQADAEADIIAANLVVGSITAANSTTVSIGNVISQTPVAGSTATTGSTVDLVVSLGPVVVVDQTPWTTLLGSTGADYGDDIVIDAAGNSYVSGYTNGSLGGAVFQGGIGDMFIAKFDSSGALMWVNQEGTAEMDRAMRVTLDAAGNAYITGYTAGDLAGTNADFGTNDYFIAKYDPNGNRVWWNQYGTLNGQSGVGISVAPSGDIYVCGSQAAVATGPYAFLTKFDSTGSQLWTDTFGANSVAGENCTDVTVGSDGFIYMTGATGGCLTAACPGGGDIFMAKYDSAGNQQWLMETGLAGRDYAGKIAVDAAGNSYVSASTTTTLSGSGLDFGDMITVKVDTNGVLQWLQQVGTTTLDQGRGVAVDANGTVYAVGSYGVGPAIVLVEYDTNGVQLSLDTLASGNGDTPTAIAVDAAGTNYSIAGYTSGDLDGQINAGIGADIFVTHNNPTPVAGAVIVTVPGVVGLAQATAEAAIVAANLVVGTITTATSATVPAGNIISQNPAAGASIAEGSTVSLVVSSGPGLITVPGVVGLAQADAESAIVAVGLTVGAITTVNSTTVAAGDVISQNPAAGSTVATGSAIDLVISLGAVVVIAPIADAGVDQTVNEFATVDLDGTASSDADGTIVGYAWTQTAGTAVTLSGATTATPSFTAPAVDADTLLSFSLVVTDDVGATGSASVSVTVNNVLIAPVANAGANQTVTEGNTVNLDGNASSDANGTIVSYTWTQTAGTAVTLSGAATATPSFTAPAAPNSLTFGLTVMDNDGQTATASVNINVNAVAVANYEYYVLNPLVVNGDMEVVSLVDGNTITAGGTTLNLNQNQSGTIPAADLAQGTRIAGTGPFDIGSTENNTDLPVPGAFAGTAFVLPHFRSTHLYYLLSPNGSATATIDVGGVVTTLNLTQGNVVEFNAGFSTTVSGIVISDSPILMAHRTGNNRDAYPVPPAATELWGIRSNNVVIGALQNNTSLTVYASDGSSASFNINAGARLLAIVGSGGSEGAGNAIHIVADAPIAATQDADSDGLEATGFWAASYQATNYALPVATQYVAIACPSANTTITLNDGGAIDSQTCSANGNTPGKAYFGSTVDGININAGAIISSDQPIYLYYEEASNNDEHNLLGNVSLGPVPVPDVAVPSVTGLAQATAESAITAAGLTVGTITSSNSATVPAGDVISQSPLAGTLVFTGDAVNLEVSLGPVIVTTPDVVGLSQAAAESAITAVGLTVGTITSANSATVLLDNVISQTPVAATAVVLSTAIDLEISLGPALIFVAVPDVVGLAQATAETAITTVGLVIGTITSVNDATVVAGDVISQNPTAATLITEASAVDLVISLGPIPLIPPVANAGVAQTVNQGATVTLDGTASSDADGTVDSYTWTQTAGANVVLSNTTSATPTFTAPAGPDVLTFSLTVTDNDTLTDSTSVSITVNAVVADHKYYVLNPRIDNSSIQVVSLADGNTITAGGTTLNLDQYEVGTIPSADLGQGTRIAGTQAFDIGGNVNNTDMPVPASFAGTQFVLPHYRSTHYYYLLSPNSDAAVTIDIGGSVSNLSLAQGIVRFFNAGSSTTISGMVTSDVPILMSHRTSAGYDAYPVPPATTEIYGVRTNNVVLGAAEDNTSITVYASNGASGSYNLDAGERVLATVGSRGSEGSGNAIHIVADKPIAAIQAADSDGFEATSFWSPDYAATRFALPVNTQYVAVVCLQAGTTITLNDGGATDTQTCSANGQFPAKEFFGSTVDGIRINGGATIESNNPIYVIYEASATSDEHNLLGN